MKIPSTVGEQVSDIKDLDISYRVLHPAAIINDIFNNKTIKIPFSSLTNKYRDFLKEIIIEIELNDEEQIEYLFRPKSLSNYLYGSTEFWNDLLILNDAYFITQFKPKKVKIYDPDRFKEYLNEILILEDMI